MTRPSAKATIREYTPEEWLSDLGEAPVHLDSSYDLVTDPELRATIPARERRRAVAHAVAVAVREARQNSVGTQVAAANAWGRAQSQVSRLEADPSVAQLGTIIDYLTSMNVDFSMRFAAGLHVFEMRMENGELVTTTVDHDRGDTTAAG
jgi:hypothetical protein